MGNFTMKRRANHYWGPIAVLATMSACLAHDPEGDRFVGKSSEAQVRFARSLSPELQRAAPLRRAFIAARMAEAGPEHVFVASGEEGALRAASHEQGLTFTVASDGLIVTTASRDGWQGGVRLVGVGRVGAKRVDEAARIEAEGSKVTLWRGAVTEWYQSGPLGLEQGIDVAERPMGEGPLVAEILVSENLQPAPDGSGRAVILLEGEEGRLRYTDLFAEDACGQQLSTRMEVEGQTIRLLVDDEHAVYPIMIDPLIWLYQQELRVHEGIVEDRFGAAIAISGDTAIVGAYDDDEASENAGAAYVFVRNEEDWLLQAKLMALDAAPFEAFGLSVGISGDTAIVSASGDGDGGCSSPGTVYVFVRSGEEWNQQARIANPTPTDDDHFGAPAAISGDTAIIGSRGEDIEARNAGAAYIFVRSGEEWTEQARIAAHDAEEYDWFGSAVAISNDTAVVGHRNWGANSGMVYVFERSGETWPLQGQITGREIVDGDFFGNSVAISGDTIVAGADAHRHGGLFGSGAAYVFERNEGSWNQRAELIAHDAAEHREFGCSVAISGDRIVVGDVGDDHEGFNTGSAYVFARGEEVWSERSKLVAHDAAAGAFFGSAVAISGNTAIVSAQWDDIRGEDYGSVYVFREGLETGDACTEPSECHSHQCVDGVCCDTACGDGLPTDCQACSVALGAAENGNCGPLRADVATTVTCRAASGECDAAETCNGSDLTCPDDDVHAMDGEICTDSWDWTVDDICEAGLCSGTELGSCGAPLTVDAFPYTHSTTSVGRPSHIDGYGVGCDIEAPLRADVVYELAVEADDSFDITVDPTGFDAALIVLNFCADSEDCLAAADESESDEAEHLRFTATADGSYSILVEGEGDFTLTIEEVAGSDGDADGDGDTDSDSDGDLDGDGDSDGDADGDGDGDVEEDGDVLPDGDTQDDLVSDDGGCSCRLVGASRTCSTDFLLRLALGVGGSS